MFEPELPVVRARMLGATCFVVATGELDLIGSQSVEGELMFALAASPEILVLDLTQVTFIESSSIRVCLHTRAISRLRGVRFVLLTRQGPVERLFALCGLTELFACHETRATDRTIEDHDDLILAGLLGASR